MREWIQAVRHEGVVEWRWEPGQSTGDSSGRDRTSGEEVGLGAGGSTTEAKGSSKMVRSHTTNEWRHATTSRQQEVDSHMDTIMDWGGGK